MGRVLVREAEIGDCDRIFELLQEFRRYENHLHATSLTVDDLKRDGFGEENLFKCIVAELKNKEKDTTIIGYGLFCYEYSGKVGKIIFMEDLYVKEVYRGAGYGTKLFKTIAKIGVENGCKKMRWRVWCQPWNQKTVDFYKRHGAEDLSDNDIHLFNIEGDMLQKLAT